MGTRLKPCPSLDGLFPELLGSPKAALAKLASLKNLIWKVPRFSRPFLATTLFFLLSRPGFPATLRWTRLRVRLSRKKRRMEFANANNLNRKSGGAKPACPGVPWKDLRFRGPLLEPGMTKWRLVFP